MDNVVPFKIQIISIVLSVGFLFYIGRLILRGKLREEYSFVWVFGALMLILFSFWRDGIEVVAKLLGVFAPPNLIFTSIIFVILIYLLHLSVVVSKLQSNNKELTQTIAMMKNKLEKKEQEFAEEFKKG
jgi:hypothetical protein